MVDNFLVSPYFLYNLQNFMVEPFFSEHWESTLREKERKRAYRKSTWRVTQSKVRAIIAHSAAH